MMLREGEIAPANFFDLSPSLFRNLEAFEGDVLYRPPSMSKNMEVRIARADIVRKARDVERFAELIRGGLDRKADMTVGPRLRVHPQPDFELLGIDDPEARKRFIRECKRAFNNWAYDSRKLCDAEGDCDFGGMVWMAYRNVEGPDGECAGVIHYEEARRRQYNTRWATFVTILDPDRVETPPERAADDDVFEGKRLDTHGRMIGMWVRKKHPSEETENAYVFVPRETPWGRPMAFHYFVKTRGGQKRGITNLVTTLRRTGMLDSFDTSYVAAAGVSAELLTYIKTKSSAATVAEALAPGTAATLADGGGWGYFGQKVDYYGKRKFRIGKGGHRLPVLAPDDEIEMASVDRALADPSPFRAPFLREQASAVGVPISFYTQNYSDTNYSSERASRLDAQLGIVRNRVHFSSMPDLIYSAVIEEAIAEGWIEFDPSWPPFQENRYAYCACAWTGPGMGMIDMLKEANAYRVLVNELKVTSRQRVAAERGDDFFEILEEHEAEQLEAEDRGIALLPPAPGAAAAGGMETTASGVPKTKGRKGAKPNRDGDGDGSIDEGE